MRGVLRRWREWRDAREEYRASVDEMQFHIDRETEHNLRGGMAPREARRAALKAFGGVDRFAEEARDERPGTRWTDFRMSYLDWKLGARMLVKYPGVSIIGVITLAAAIGLGAAWFDLTLMMFDPDLPLDDGERVVRVEYWDATTLDPEHRTMHEFVQWREQLTTIEQLGAHRTVRRNLVVPGRAPEPVQVAEITASAFDVTRVPPLLGRPLNRADEEPGSEPVVVIGHSAWQRHFAGDRTVVGREVQLGSARATIVGVMPEGYRFPRSHQFWMPLRTSHAEPLEGVPIEVFGRLRPGATLEGAGAELAAWGTRMAQVSPETHGRLRPRVLPFAASGEESARSEIFFINLFAWAILILACMNVASLMFARTALREHEIVVRNALGASRGRVMGQLFTESLVLTCVAAVVGLVAMKTVMSYALDLEGTRHSAVPFWWEANIEPLTIIYTGLLAIVGAGMVALLPALRVTGRHVRANLTEATAGGTSMRFGGAWSVIIVLQVAFSVICLPFGIVAVVESYQESRLRAAWPADAYLTFRTELDEDVGPATAGSARDRMPALLDELSIRLENEPEVAGVAFTNALPGLYHPLRRIEAQRGSDEPFVVDSNTEGDRVRIGAVSPGFFEVFNVALTGGRDFRPSDVTADSRVVLINESLARNIGGNPIGTSVRLAALGDEAAGPWHEVVGVVANFGLTPTSRGEADFMYMPVAAADAGYVVVRAFGDGAALERRLRTLAVQLDPALAVVDVLTLREMIRRQDESMVLATMAGTGVVLLAIILSAASLYALMSVVVALRTREVGIRVAIGASPRAVVSALFRRAATQVGVGIIVGNIVVGLLLYVMLEEVQAEVVLLPMAIASTVMLLVGTAACLAPARRALRIEPTEALREGR